MRRHTTKRSFWIDCIQELGTITGRGFLDRYIREQGAIKTQEEEDKVSGRTGGKRNNDQELANIDNSGSLHQIYKGIFTQGSFQCT